MDLTTQASDTELVRAARDGDGAAFGVLFERWFDRTYDVAYRIVRDREVAAEVAQDAFLAAWRGLDRLERLDSFGGWLLRISRNRALNRLERERRSIAVDDEEATGHVDRRHPQADEAPDAVARAEDAELVWTAAAALGPRDASVLDLHLRHGLTPGEIAAELDVTPNNAHQILHRLKGRLGEAVRAAVVWRGGRPSCPDLATELTAAGSKVGALDADTVALVSAHARGCDTCTARQRARLAPEALFAAAPIAVAAPSLRTAARAGLRDAGVPVPDGAGAVGGGAAQDEGPDASEGASSGTTSAPGTEPRRPGRGPALAAIAGAVVLVVLGVWLLADDDAGPDAVATGATTSTVDAGRPSTTAAATSSSTTTTAADPSSTTTIGSLPAPAPTTAPPAIAPDDTPPGDDPATGTDPPLTPATTSPPAPTTTSTTVAPEPPAPPPPPDPDPPAIGSFTATRTPGPGCATPSARVVLAWSSSGGTTRVVTGTGAPPGTQPASGSLIVCSPAPATWTLTVTGPGGSTTDSATA